MKFESFCFLKKKKDYFTHVNACKPRSGSKSISAWGDNERSVTSYRLNMFQSPYSAVHKKLCLIAG